MLHPSKYRPKVNQLFIWIILFCLPFCGLAQQYQFKNFSLAQGLAQSQVYAMLEDDRGYIWMGTRGGGISRFNGLEFTNYSMQNGLKDNYILCLKQDKSQRVWIGSNTGLTLFESEEFTALKFPIGDTEVQTIYEDDLGNIWVGTADGLFKKRKGINEFGQHQIKGFKNGRINFIEQDSLSQLWIGTNVGIFLLDQKGVLLKRYGRRSGIKNTQVKGMGIDLNGTKWVGTYGYGMFAIENKKVKRLDAFEPFSKLENAIISSVQCDSKGYVWISTLSKGLCRYNPRDSSYLFLTETDGLANNNVKTVLEDQWGNYWIGTSGGGVSKYSGQQFEAYTTKAGLPGNYIYSIFFDNEAKLWTGTSGGGVTFSDSAGFGHFNLDSGFTDAKVKTIYQDQDSIYWFGTEGKGLFCFDGDTFRSFDNSDGLGGIWIKDVIGDSKGNIWTGASGGGITKITPDYSIDSLPTFDFKRFRIRNGLMSNRINALHEDNYGRIWYASQTSGVGFIQNDTLFKYYDVTNGLAGNNVRCITEDAFGNLWIGSSTGLSTISTHSNDPEKSIRSFALSDGLSSSNIYLIVADKDDNIWIGTEKGVDRIRIDSGGNFLETRYFGKDDGFTGVETTQNAVSMDSSGNVWFGTINGMYKYLTQVNIKNEKAPILNFTGVSMNYKPLTTWDSLVFEYDQNQISFEYQGITQTLPKKIKYKYRLKGLKEEWSPASLKNSVTFSNLQPGNYTFQVYSCNENDVWNEEPLELSFEITPPFWMETWFLITGIGSILFVLGAAISLRIRVIRRKERAKQEKLQLERDLISVEQKALRLQMNPHFIFNSLNSIQALIATGDDLGARKNLSGFSKLMRQILENSRKNKITLEEEISTLQNYLTIEKECNDGAFEFTFDLAQDLETELIEIPPMILQPFVENAIKHGMSEKKDSGKIQVSFSLLHEDLLLCTVRDNGIGRKKAEEKKRESTNTHESTALNVTEERLQLLDNEEGNIEIIDLYDSEELSSGTEIRVSIPL